MAWRGVKGSWGGTNVFLQSYVLPICVYSIDENGSAIVQRLHGTCFLINERGTFLTAAHVLRNATSDAERSGLLIGIVCKDENGNSPKSIVARLMFHDFAPNNADIAVGQTLYLGETIFQLWVEGVEVWQDVGTYGYPEEAVTGSIDMLNLNLRAHKGYIQRLIRKGDIFAAPDAVGYELSFLLARGLSGAPLFVHGMPKEKVIGICTGSFRSEVVEDQIVEIANNGSKYVEKRVSISQYGLSESIAPLLDWKPEGFGGETLAILSGGHEL